MSQCPCLPVSTVYNSFRVFVNFKKLYFYPLSVASSVSVVSILLLQIPWCPYSTLWLYMRLKKAKYVECFNSILHLINNKLLIIMWTALEFQAPLNRLLNLLTKRNGRWITWNNSNNVLIRPKYNSRCFSSIKRGFRVYTVANPLSLNNAQLSDGLELKRALWLLCCTSVVFSCCFLGNKCQPVLKCRVSVD